MPIGVWEIALIVAVLVLIFGSKRLPEMGRSLGRGLREFKDGLTGTGEAEELPPRRDEPAP